MIDVLLDPQIWLVILVISVLGALARLTNYYAGLRGKDTIITLYPRIKPETWKRVLKAYKNLGPLPLLGAGISIIGTFLTIAAGMAGIGRNPFLNICDHQQGDQKLVIGIAYLVAAITISQKYFTERLWPVCQTREKSCRSRQRFLPKVETCPKIDVVSVQFGDESPVGDLTYA